LCAARRARELGDQQIAVEGAGDGDPPTLGLRRLSPTARVRESMSFRMSMPVEARISSRATNGVFPCTSWAQVSASGLEATDFRSTYPMRVASFGTNERDGPAWLASAPPAPAK
jgi:hypothetical protein